MFDNVKSRSQRLRAKHSLAEFSCQAAPQRIQRNMLIRDLAKRNVDERKSAAGGELHSRDGELCGNVDDEGF